MIDQQLLDRCEELIQKGERLVPGSQAETRDILGVRRDNVDIDLFAEWRNRSLHFLKSILESDSVYANQFERVCFAPSVSDAWIGLGILRAVRDDIRAGYLGTLRERVHADVFSDFLEMAEYLESDGFKDAAAVLAGGVLERVAKPSRVRLSHGQGPADRPSGCAVHRPPLIVRRACDRF